MIYDIIDELEIIRLLHILPKEYIWREISKLNEMVERLEK